MTAIDKDFFIIPTFRVTHAHLDHAVGIPSNRPTISAR